MKHTTRLLALSALVLAVVMAAIGAPALNAPGVAFAQGQVPDAPVITATRSGASTISLSWTAPTGAESYILYAYDSVNEWVRLDVGDDFPLDRDQLLPRRSDGRQALLLPGQGR